VLGVNYQEAASGAVSILDELGATYPAVLDIRGKVAEHYRVGTGLPSSFFVDADGILRSQQIGQITRDQLAAHLETVGVTWDAGKAP
jgi:cytochrome c biogenesis protein CcmG, thiol:disulfide interchange protein DsbE